MAGIESRATTNAGHFGVPQLGPAGSVPAVSSTGRRPVPAAPIQAGTPAATVPATIQTVPASGSASKTNQTTVATTTISATCSGGNLLKKKAFIPFITIINDQTCCDWKAK